MTDCKKCVYAIMDYEEYHGTTPKEWFVTGCEKCYVVEQSDCPEFEEREDRMSDRFGYGEIGLDIHPCNGCEDYNPPNGCKTRGGCGNPVTNADRIRSLSDGELADFLWGIGNNPVTGTTYVSGKPIFTNQDGYKGWLDWLTGNVEDGERQ